MPTKRDPLQALLLGGVAWNTMVYVDSFPEPRPQTVFTRGSHETVGSSGAGKALNLRHLGADVTVWGLIGDDAPGRRIREVFQSRGINFISAIDPEGTMRHINLMDANGDRISIFANPGSQDFDVAVESVADAAGTADVVSVTIMNYCRQFLPMLQEIDKPIWVDIHDYDGINPYHREFVEAADYLLMSSVAHPDWRSFLEERIAAGTRAAICTHGSAGASGLTAEEGWVDIDAVAVSEAVDTNGAGDAFFAGFVTAWMEEERLRNAMHHGAKVAGAAVQSPDLAPPPHLESGVDTGE
ncbi:MAG: PfkB family carbohydrate kinase [Actinomycetota bacterium]|nr:PfkB family carbohydrate kinase [Actinomycetota bacterium]